jgi:hypothetical protein
MMSVDKTMWVRGLVLLGSMGFWGAQGALAVDAATPLHPWQVAVKPGAAQAYFTNLKDGDEIQMPFVAHFGLSQGWGLAPIQAPAGGKSGHHHLLINRDLPLDFKQPLPFNDQYIHFGKGQMETTLNLAPGEYTLRMLLADDKHLPRFVYSKPLKVTVSQQRAKVEVAAVTNPSIALIVDKGLTSSRFRVLFHASNLNVGHLAQKISGSGHFRLSVLPLAGGKAAEFDFVDGETEIWLQPPAGEYKLSLSLVDNVDPDKNLTEMVHTTVSVK